MFSESLLDSSARVRKVRHWPMATAFTLEAAAAAIAILLPLLSNVIPVHAHVTITAPLRSVPIAERNSNTSTANATHSPGTMVVQLMDHPNIVSFSRPLGNASEPPAIGPDGAEGSGGIPDNLMKGTYVPPQPPPPERPRRISVLSEALLVKKVEPIYPHIASVAGISGTVKLHAIIGTSGEIENLNVVAGHPLLAEAALEAVRQWRYKPYVLNGQPIEVETFITVVFRKARQ